jgi:hypothetical protein
MQPFVELLFISVFPSAHFAHNLFEDESLQLVLDLRLMLLVHLFVCFVLQVEELDCRVGLYD